MTAQRNESAESIDAIPEPIFDITPEEAWEIFDHNARFYMGMSGAEFRRKWNAREFGDVDRHPDHLKLIDVAMLLSAVEGYKPEL
jgi:hypothetical protein